MRGSIMGYDYHNNGILFKISVWFAIIWMVTTMLFLLGVLFLIMCSALV